MGTTFAGVSSSSDCEKCSLSSPNTDNLKDLLPQGFEPTIAKQFGANYQGFP